MRGLRTVFIAAVVATGAVLCAGGLCAFEEETKVIDGEVEAVNELDRNLTIKYMVDDINIVYEQLTFNDLPAHPRIFKGDDMIDLDDMQVGDNVTVKYYPGMYDPNSDKYSQSKLVSMTVEQ
ncbi:MAG: hypothetical protein WC592_06460 [Candidatus Omnitrophota bacterium]